MSVPSVSVIIPAYNAALTIGNALQALADQSYAGRLEVIVVDDGSGDGTSSIIRRYPEVRLIVQSNAGPASARNRGAAAAAGDILLFTDADCVPEQDWIRKLVAGFDASSVGVVAGSYGIANPGSQLARIIHSEIRFRHLTLMSEFPRAFGSYNFAIRRDIFGGIGGFDTSYRRASGEDNDLSYKVLKAGVRIRFLREALVAHYHQEDLLRYLKEQFRHGFWRVRLYRVHPEMAAGDGYTFWKDMVEVPLAAAHVALIFWPQVWLGVAAGFFIFELVAGVWITGSFQDGCAAGVVMWARSFARTAGFLNGFLNGLISGGKIPEKSLKKS